MPTIDLELGNDSKFASFTKHAGNESMSYLHSFPLNRSKDEVEQPIVEAKTRKCSLLVEGFFLYSRRFIF
jgi:hypothetical protein